MPLLQKNCWVFQPCEKGQRDTAWIRPGWSRTAVATVCTALSAAGAATGTHWRRTVRPTGRDAGIRPPASPGDRSPHGCVRMLVLCFFHNHQVLAAHQPVVTLVNNFSLTSNEIVANPGVDIIREVLRRQGHTGREVRRLGPLEHPSALPRSTLRRLSVETSRRARQHIGTSSSHQWGLLAFTVRSKHSFQGSPDNGLNGDFGNFGKRAFQIASPGSCGHHAASSTPLLVSCQIDLNPADGPSRHGQKSSARRPWKGAQEATASDCWTFA